jgi:integrase
MQEMFKRIKKHLYRREYRSSDGELLVGYYARFKDWKGIHRKFVLGSQYKTACEQLTIYEARNIRREDFDLDRKEPAPEPERMTVSRYIPQFLGSKKGMPSYGFWKVCTNHLNRLLGSVPLDEVTRSKIVEYKQLRKTEPIMRHGKPVKGTTVSASTVNREITALVGLLNLAAENDLLEKLPATKKLKDAEGHLSRERILDADEYKALLDCSPRWLQRIIITAYEACLSRVDLLTLTTEEVHRKRPETAMIKLTDGRNKTKAKQKIPISPALATVLDELTSERRKLTSLHGANLVFTRDGKPISRNALRKAFDAVTKQAKVKDFHFHDLRHCAVTKWALAGIPEELRKIAAGHSRGSVHQRYINPPDEEMVRVFSQKLGWENCTNVVQQELRQAAESAK